MASVEDMLGGHLLVTVAIGATALVLTRVLPGLSPPLRSAIKGGLSLLLEAEGEAEGGIIEQLAETALTTVMERLSGPGSTNERRDAARAAIEDYKQTARTRARRYGSDPDDRSARRGRHLAALRRKLHRAKSHAAGAHAQDLDILMNALGDTGQA
jgi:hypothetical protein